MAHPVLYHCSHTEPLSEKPPSLDPTLTVFSHRPLAELLFCEECDAIRCERCVACEVSYYYCPNCLFEVPAASVRGERNRCARNCFLCPQCDHTLSVVATDPDPSVASDPRAPAASIGEPPYHLSCSFCRWDSKEVNITFEKPTGLASQLQKYDDEAPELLEFDRLKEHFEPFLKAQMQQHAAATASHHHLPNPGSSISSIHSAASAALSRELPSFLTSSRYGSMLSAGPSVPRLALSRSLPHLNAATADHKDEPAPYTPLFACGSTRKGKRANREVERVELLRQGIVSAGGTAALAPVSKRWGESWDQALKSSDLRPLRIPLRSKRTKRCPSCKHILIKPEQKAQSTRFKIKLVAGAYIPQMELARRSALPGSLLLGSRLTAAATAGRRGTGKSLALTGAGKEGEEQPLQQGRSYTFELTLINPLYEPISVRLAVPPPPPPQSGPALASDASLRTAVPTYAITLPAPSFSISAFAEAWEYDEEDEDDGVDDDFSDAKRSRLSVGGSNIRRRGNAPGILERKANRTTVAVEVTVGKDFLGLLRSNMLVTFTYQSDEAAAESKKSKASNVEDIEGDKTFTFWTALTFGNVVAKPAGAGARQSMIALRDGSGFAAATAHLSES